MDVRLESDGNARENKVGCMIAHHHYNCHIRWSMYMHIPRRPCCILTHPLEGSRGPVLNQPWPTKPSPARSESEESLLSARASLASPQNLSVSSFYSNPITHKHLGKGAGKKKTFPQVNRREKGSKVVWNLSERSSIVESPAGQPSLDSLISDSPVLG